MLRAIFASIAILASTAAYAYEPITIDEKTYNAIMQHLGDVPAKYSMPLIQYLNQAEMQADADKKAKEAKEAAPAGK